MAVLLDVKNEVTVENRDLEKGIPLHLTQAQKSEIVMTKYISTNNLMADFQPDGEWIRQVTADVGGGNRKERLIVNTESDPRGLQIDDGIYVTLVGTMDDMVGIIPGRPPMSDLEVESYADQTGDNVPMYQCWNFRVREACITNGPEARANLARSEDQKRASNQADMYEAFKDMYQAGSEQQAELFGQMMNFLKKDNPGDDTPSMESVIKAAKGASKEK
tara:strand:- start:167 stop:823 length:657 start_codon:yes stop_codon:yes gene_type:complete